MIKLHKSMVQANSEAHLALSKAVQQAQDGMAERLKFAAAIENFQQQLLRDLEASSDKSRSYFAKAMKSMEVVAIDISSRLTNAVSSVQNSVADLDEVSVVTISFEILLKEE